jgi:hypothetical protein
MPYSILASLAHAAIVLPIVWAWCLVGARDGESWGERLLRGMVLTWATMLAELGVCSLVTEWVPLRESVPWVHGCTCVVAVFWAVRRREHGRAMLAQARARFGRTWLLAPGWVRGAWLITMVTLLLAWVYSGWNAMDEHDGAMYRWAVVMQPVQDGFIGRVPFGWFGFADAYPRTIELLYSWSVMVAGNTVGVHLVNAQGLLVLMLSAWVMSRRVGVGRIRASLASCFVATTPMAVYLTCVLYNDLPASAALAAGAAFSQRRRLGGGGWTWRDCAMMLATLTLAASCKANMAMLAGIVGLWKCVEVFRSRRASSVSLGKLITLGSLSAGIASIPYVRSWLLYGSPVWPIRVVVGKTTLFDGPLNSDKLNVGAKGTWLEQWTTAIYKIFQTTSQDASGAFGLYFAVGIFPVCLLLIPAMATRPALRKSGTGLLALLFLAFLAFPLSTNLRYSLYVLPAAYTLVFLHLPTRNATRWGAWIRLLPAFWCVMVLVHATDWARAVVKEVSAQQNAGVSLWSAERNRAWYDQFMYIEPGMNPEAHRLLHERVPRGGRLITSVSALPGLMHDGKFSYAVEFRSIASVGDRKAPPVVRESPPELAERWTRLLVDGRLTHALVYVPSQEDSILREQGWEPAGEVDGKGRWPMVRLWARRDRQH